MSSKGGYTAAPPRQGGDRFYNPPMVRRHQQVLQQQLMQRQLLHQQQQQQQQQQQHQQQQQLQKRAAAKPGTSAAAASAAAEKQTDGGESSMAVAMPVPQSVGAASTVEITNLDRLMDSVTPFIQARYLTEVGPTTGTSEVEPRAFFYLEDLWESFSEWSVYGAGVPLLLNGRDSIEQYYCPFLSGIQLFSDPSSQHRLTDSTGSSDFAGARIVQAVQDVNLQRLSRLSMADKSALSPDEINSPGLPLFQHMEYDQPYNRRPLADKISCITAQRPELAKFRSCDLLPTSWMCVAWYPIYRIPVGPTLQDLDASFLTFHSLSTQTSSICPPSQLHEANTRIVRGCTDPTAKISLPVFALASYKLKGSILSPCGPHELEQENKLLKAADDWLKRLKINLPDYSFFCNHNSYRSR